MSAAPRCSREVAERSRGHILVDEAVPERSRGPVLIIIPEFSDTQAQTD